MLGFFELLFITFKLVAAVSSGAAALQTWAAISGVLWLWGLLVGVPLWALDRPSLRERLPKASLLVGGAVFGLMAALLIGGVDRALYLEEPEFPREVERLRWAARVFGLAVLFVVGSAVWPRCEGWLLRRAKSERLAASVLGLAALLMLISSHFALDPVHEVRLAGGATLAAPGLLALCLRVLAWPQRPNDVKVILGAGGMVAVLAAVVPGASREHARFVLWGHSTLAGLSEITRRALDFDRDAVLPSWLLGGGDCAPGDRNVSPLELERPGDGVDQDCRGGDAKAPLALPARAQLPAKCAELPARPDIVVVTVDALRADALRPDIMPALSELAKSSLLFSRAYSPTAMTFTSVPAMLSGRAFADVGPKNALLDENLTPKLTLPEALRAAGYRTAAISEFFDHAVFHRGFQRVNRYWHDTPVRGVKGSLSSASMSRGVLEELEQGTEPALVWVHLADTHAHYSLDDQGAVAERVAYYRGASYVDRQLGRLLTELQRKGRLQRTLIAITADHGEELLARGRQGHGPSVFEESVHVPLLVWAPGCAGRRVARPVSTSRLAPTLAALAGVDFSGLGLFDESRLPVVVEAVTGLETTYERAVIDERYKLMLDVTNGGRMLFDLKEDPEELTDVLGDAPEVAARLDAAYQRWLDSPGGR